MKIFDKKAAIARLAVLLLSFVLWVSLLAPSAVAQETRAQTDQLEALIDVLRDDQSREAFIAQLEDAIGLPPESVQAAETPPDISFGRRLALLTQSIAQDSAERVGQAVAGISSAGATLNGVGIDEVSILGDALIDLLLVIALTVAIFVVLRSTVAPIFKRFGDRAKGAGIVQIMVLFSVSVAIDAAIVVIAWAAGFIATTAFLGDFGQIGIRQSLYLNAFLIVELVKVTMRSVISPSAEGLRPLPLADDGARRLNKYLNVVVSVLGYGQLLVVPIINQAASYMAGRSTSAAISLFILVFLAFAIIRHRKSVASWMIDTLAAPDAGVAEGAGTTNGIAQPPKAPRGAALVRNWYWFALAYLLFIFGTVMAGSTTALVEAVTGSGKIAAALILASVLSRYLTNSMSSGVHLPDEVNLKLPLLERRLNAFVPKALFVLRYVLLAIVLLFALDVIGALSLRSWLESQIGLQLTTKLLSVATIVLVITLIWLAVTSWVDYRLNPDYGSIPTAREMTLLSLFRNAATIVLLAFGLMFSLSEIGLDIGPLLASAGVLGLAIGFGAQKMVQDIITGVFIQFENAINVGDVITVGGITGGVEKLSVRSVSLRDVHGVFHIIPFSSVDMVSNFTREFSYFVCDMGIAYRENVEEAKQAMFDAYEQLRQDEDQAPFLLGDLEWFGLNTFGDSAVVVRARIKTLPGKQWGVGRAYNGLLKTIFDERGIEIPFPHQTIYFGESKGGTTQTLNISAEPSMDVSD